MFDSIQSHLPDKVAFYHLGWVEKSRESSRYPSQENSDLLDALSLSSPTEREACLYQISGDLRGTFVLIFPKSLDPSAYWELGNLIFSQWANEIARNLELDVAVSYPLTTQLERVKEWARSTLPKVQEFTHIQNGEKASVLALSFFEPNERIKE